MPNHYDLDPVVRDVQPMHQQNLSIGKLASRAIRKHFGIGLLIFILLAPAAVGLAWWKNQPYYQSTAILEIQPSKQRIIYNVDDNEFRRYDTFFNSMMEQIKQPSLLNHCLTLDAFQGLPLLLDSPDRLRTLREALEVNKLGNTQYFSVSLKQEGSPYKLKEAVQAIVDQYLARIEDENKKKQENREKLLVDQQEKLQQEFNDKAKALQTRREEVASQFDVPTTGFSMDPRTATKQAINEAAARKDSLEKRVQIYQETLKKEDFFIPTSVVDDALNQDPEIQRLTTMSQQLRQSVWSTEMEAKSPSSTAVEGRVDSDPEITFLKQEIARQQLDFTNLSQKLEKDHPKLKSLSASIAGNQKRLDEIEAEKKKTVKQELQDDAKRRNDEYKTQLAEIEKKLDDLREQKKVEVIASLKKEKAENLQRQIQDLTADAASLDAHITNLQSQLDTEQDSYKQYELAMAGLKTLEEDTNRKEQALRLVEQRLHELRVEAAAPGYIRLVDPPRAPNRPEPFKSRRLKHMIAGVFGAAFAAFVVMLLLVHNDDTIWSADDLDKANHVKLLGSIPDGGRRLQAPENAAFVCQGGQQSLFSEVIAEQIWKVTTSILYPREDGPPKSVLITSAAKGDGKTTMAVNVATCIASLNKRVLLLDADFRNPSIARFFQLSNVPGLGEILVDGRDPAEVIHVGNVLNLSVLTAGEAPVNESRRIAPFKMKEIFDQLSEEYDHIIIDAPPMTLSDSLTLAPMVDGVVCLFKAQATRRADVENSLHTLKQVGARTIGMALMGVDIRDNGVGATFRSLNGYRP